MNVQGVDGIHVLAHTSRLASLQVDHHQLIFLLRLAESLAELSGQHKLVMCDRNLYYFVKIQCRKYILIPIIINQLSKQLSNAPMKKYLSKYDILI